MIACPNKSSREWKNLTSKIGEFEAMREYIRLGDGSIPNADAVLGLPDKFSRIDSPGEVKLMKEDAANSLMEFLNNKFPGLDGVVINDKEQKWKGKLANGTTPTINLAYAEMSDGFHEFAHPFLMSLRVSNPDLFNNLYDNLQNTPEWETIKELAQSKVQRLYPELTSADPSLFKEEVLSTAIGYAAERRTTESQEKVSRNLGRVIEDFFKWINEFVHELFSTDKDVTKLSSTTTFAEVVDMFTDTKNKLILDGNWMKLVENSWIGDAMVQAVTTNQESVSDVLNQDLSNAMVADEKLDIEAFVNQWLDKTFKLPKKDYKPRKIDPGQLAYNMAQNMLSQAVKQGFQLRGTSLKSVSEEELKALPSGYSFSENTIQKLASVLQPIQLNYKFANYLTNKKNNSISLKQPFVTIREIETKNSDGSISIQELASVPMTMQEAGVVQEFQAFLTDKYSDRKSMTADQINDEYMQWVTDNYGINWTEATGHVGYGMDRVQTSSSKLNSYTRIVFIDDYFNQNGHNFQIKGTGLSGNGIGWYAKAEINGDRFDHEFQSDILPEIRKSFKQGAYESTETKKLKYSTESTRFSEVSNLAKSKLNKMLMFAGDFLLERTQYLKNQIYKLDPENNVDITDAERIMYNELDDVELPFSKIDNLDAAALERDKQFLLSEVDVQIQELKQENGKWGHISHQKGYTKIYNLWLGRKSDDQQELFDWIKTFEIVEIDGEKHRQIATLDPDELPFSKIEGTEYRKEITTISNTQREQTDVDDFREITKLYKVYATEESIRKFPKSLKKILNLNNEWANSNAPLKPDGQTEEYFRNSLYSTAAQLINSKTLEIKKNYGYNKTKIQETRNRIKENLDKNFKSYKFAMSRLKALEFRKQIYSNTANIVRIAEYYKGQYNRFYKFYNSIYDSAKIIAEEEANSQTEKGKDVNYLLYKKYNDLYDNWFNIIIPQSIISAKAEGRNHYYLPTATAMNAIEGNPAAEDVYWTPDDNKMLMNKIVSQVGTNEIVRYISQNTPEVNEALRPHLTSDLISRNGLSQTSTAEEIAYVISNETTFTTDSEEFKTWLSQQNINQLTKPNGPLYNALVKYARKNNIKLTFEQPGWSKHTLIKVDLTKFEAKPIDRFSKLDPDSELQDIERTDGAVLANAVPTEQEQKQQIGEKIVYEMANMLVQNFGVSFEIVTPDQARILTKDTEVPWNGEPAFFFNGKVYFTQEGFTMENVLHEYAHPLLDCLHAQNPVLFNKLLAEFLVTPEGAQVLQEVIDEYKRDIDVTDPRFAKEIMARALAKEAQNGLQDKSNTKEFKGFLDKLLFNIKQLLRKVFGSSIKIEKLSTNTTLKQLADMLRGEKFEIDTDIITYDNYVEYARSVKKEAESFNEIENNDIAKTIKMFYSLVTTQISQTEQNAEKYADTIKLLVSDQTNKSLLEEIKETLQNTPELQKGKSELTELEIRQQNVENFIYAIQRFELITMKVLDHLDVLGKRSDSVQTMNDVFYYDLLSRNWSKFIEQAHELLTDNGMSDDSTFGIILNKTRGKLKTINNKIQKIYSPGVIKVLFENLQPLIAGIDIHYQGEIDNIKNSNTIGWGNKQNQIDAIQKKWDETKLTEERLADLLFGRAGDTNAISYWIESFLNSPDPIVGGLGVFVKNQYNKINAEFQRDSNEFIKEISPLLDAAGYSMSGFTKLMSKVSFKDTMYFYNADTDKLDEKVVWTFLNEFKGVNTVLKKYKYDYDEALAKGDQEETDRILKEIKQHKKDYFHQQYVDDYYNREDVYDSLEKNKDIEDAVYKILGVDKTSATKAQKDEAAAMYDKAAKEAYRRKHTILNQIKVEDGANILKEGYDEVAATKKALWREYSQLASLTNLSGNPKTGEELLSAIIENKYRKVTREFYEWVPRQGQFEFGLNTYEQQLTTEEYIIGSPEFKEKRDKWIKDNTVIKYTQQYYDDRNQVLSDIRAIMERIEQINPDIRKRIDSSAEMEEFLDIAMGYRDTDGQIMGNDISETGKKRVRDLQQAIIDKKDQFIGMSGLTRIEEEELGELFDKIQSKQKLTTPERLRMDDLLDKKSLLGVDKATRTELAALYRKLFKIQSKEATDYYVDILNNWLGKMGETEMIDNFTADSVLRPEVYNDLLAKDPEFKKWFEKNHVKKEIFDFNVGDGGAYVTIYERLYVWNRTRPNDDKYYETTKLENGEIIQGVPSLNFFNREVKEKYVTEKIVGKTVDNKGNFLPKTIAEGAKADTPYINENYEKLRNSDPAAFKVLEKMKEFHLKWQEDMDRDTRLYMQAPRYGISAGENLTLNKRVEKGRRWWLNVRNLFNKSAVNYEQLELNYMMKNQLIEVESMFDEDKRRIPVTGLSNIDSAQVSMDFLDGMLKYRHGALTQKQLLSADPFAQALKKIVNDEKNLPLETNKWSVHFLNSALSKLFPFMKESAENTLKTSGTKIEAKDYVRAKALNFFYEREFEGRAIIDGTAKLPWIWRIFKFTAGITSKAAFALNLPSAFKNRNAAILSAYIEGGGGRFMSFQSLALGKARAVAMMAELGLSGSIYSYKNKSLNIQLMQIFNVAQEFLNDSTHKHFGRSMKDDFANLSFLMSPRKFLQMEATVEILNGMLNHVKVEQKTKFGKNELRYINAWEIRNGQIELKPGIDPEYAPGGKKFNQIINQIHQVSENLEGNYAKISQPMINSYMVGRLGTYMKKFFTSMGIDHVAGTRTSASLGTIKTGSYSAMLNLIANFFKYGPQALSFMSKDQATGVRKTLTHIASVIIMQYLLRSLWGYDDDDLVKTKDAVKKRSGDLNSDNFSFWGWTQNQALVVTLGTLTEIETWSNPNLFIPQLKDQYLSWGPIYDRGVKMPWEIIKHTGGAIVGNEKSFYKRDMGPYWFQKEGSAKVWVDIANLFGLSGNTVSPLKQIESQFNVRQGIKVR